MTMVTLYTETFCYSATLTRLIAEHILSINYKLEDCYIFTCLSTISMVTFVFLGQNRAII